MRPVIVAVIVLTNLSLAIASADGSSEALDEKALSHYPIFHVRPPQGHVNDPNGPFYYNGYYHLFMQYCPKGPCSEGNYQAWAHYTSPDLAKWTEQPVAMWPDGKGCPDTHGVYTGSTTIVDNAPKILYPGIHLDAANNFTSSQCLAVPANLSDPLLREWNKTVIIKDVPPGIYPHFHDDSAAFQSSDGKWYMFVSGAFENRTLGVSMLYASTDFVNWTLEHPLVTFLQQCTFISCPEMYSLPGMPGNASRRMEIYEALCDGDVYWFGMYDDNSHTFTPFHETTNLKYDYGTAIAGKSFWDAHTSRRIQWSWVLEHGYAPKAYPGWDGAQTVPRVLTYDADLQILRVNPAAELATLHTHIAGRLDNITLRVGQAVPLKVGTDGLALDINATFHVTPAAQGHRGADSGESLRFGLLVRGRNAEDPADPNANYTAISFSQSRAGSFMNNTDIPHGDITSEDFPLPANTTDAEGATACQTFCNAHVECVGWVYVRPPDGPRCAIKGSLDAPVPAKSCCISGVKHPGLLGTQVLIDTTRAGGDSGEGSTATIPANATSVAYTLRVLVDHSIIEVYPMDGVGCATFRAYPDVDATEVYLVLLETDGSTVEASVLAAAVGSAIVSPTPTK